MGTQQILNTIPVIQSASLASYNARLLGKKKPKVKDFVEAAVGTTVGISLLKANADLIGGF